MDDEFFGDDEAASLDLRGMFSAIIACLAVFVAISMGCMYYVTSPLAVVLSIGAVVLGGSVIQTGYTGNGRAYANVGVVLGAMVGLWCAFICLLCGGVGALYALVLAAAALGSF